MANVALRDVPDAQVPTPGVVTQDVSKLATVGAGTALSPWRNWDEDLVDLVDHNREFFLPSGVYEFDNTLTFPTVGKRNIGFRGELGTILQYTGSGRCIEFPQTAESYWGIVFQKLIIERDSSRNFRKYYNRLLTACKGAYQSEISGQKNLYSPYANSDLQEFWAESAEIFFEKPHELNLQYPEV